MPVALSFDREYVFLLQLGALLGYGGVKIHLVDHAAAVEFSTLRKLVSLSLFAGVHLGGLASVWICACWQDRVRIPVHEGRLLGSARHSCPIIDMG